MLPNVGHITKSTIYYESLDKTGLVTSWTETLMSQALFQNTFILRRLRGTNFADIIKIETMFIKTTFKESIKVKRIRNYVLKSNYICIS